MNNIEVRESKTQGKGVFALRDLPEEETILLIDDTHVIDDPSALTKDQHEFELDYLDGGKIIHMQEPERYINHSCDPSSYVKTIDGIRHVVAMRDIKQDEEVTYDYSINGDNEGTFVCRCGSKNCRGIYQGSFFNLPIEIQKKYLAYLDGWFQEKYRSELEEIASQ